jgi:Anti-sigma-28 factor, FlgM
VRPDPVMELREKVARGEYRVDADLVAGAIINKALVVRRVRRWLDEAGRSQGWIEPRH